MKLLIYGELRVEIIFRSSSTCCANYDISMRAITLLSQVVVLSCNTLGSEKWLKFFLFNIDIDLVRKERNILSFTVINIRSPTNVKQEWYYKICIITKSQCGRLPPLFASGSADVKPRDISGNKFLIIPSYCLHIASEG